MAAALLKQKTLNYLDTLETIIRPGGKALRATLNNIAQYASHFSKMSFSLFFMEPPAGIEPATC